MSKHVFLVAKLSAIVAGLTALMLICVCVSLSFWVRLQAEECLHALQQIKVGESKEADVRKILEPFAKYEKEGTASILGKDYPLRAYWIENKGPHLIGVFSPARFGAGVIFRDGVVVDKGAGFTQYDRLSRVDYFVHTRESVPGFMHKESLDESPTGVAIDKWEPPLQLGVFIDTRASRNANEAAFDFDLRCFTTFLGCRNLHEILPRMNEQMVK